MTTNPTQQAAHSAQLPVSAAPEQSPRRPSRTRSVAWGLGYTAVLTIVQFVQGIVLVPLFLRHIEVSLYGAWLATGNVIAILALLDPGIGDIIRLRASQALGARNLEQAARTIGTGIVLICGLLAVLVAAGLAVTPLLPRIVQLDPRYWVELKRAIGVALVGTSLSLFGHVLGNILEATQRQRELGTATICSMVFGIGATVWFLVHSSLGVMAIALGAAFRGAMQVVVLVPLCVRALRAEGVPGVSWSGEEVREVRTIGLATFTSRIMSTMSQQADSFLTALMVGPEATVMLSVAAKPKDILQSFPSRLNFTAAPAIAHRVGEDSRQSTQPGEETSRIVLKVIVLSISLAAILMASYVALSRDFTGLWVGEKLFAGRSVTFLLGIAAVVVTAKESLGYAASAYGRLADLAWFTTAETVLRLVTAVGLVWATGLIGAPLGALVASGVILVPTALLLGRSARIAARDVFTTLGRVGAAGLTVMAAGMAVGTWGPKAESWPAFLVHGVAAVACSTLLLIIVSKDARQALGMALGRLLSAVGHRRAANASRGAV